MSDERGNQAREALRMYAATAAHRGWDTDRDYAEAGHLDLDQLLSRLAELEDQVSTDVQQREALVGQVHTLEGERDEALKRADEMERGIARMKRRLSQATDRPALIGELRKAKEREESAVRHAQTIHEHHARCREVRRELSRERDEARAELDRARRALEGTEVPPWT